MAEGLPADLVAFTDLVHAPGEGAKSRKENGHGAGALAGDPTCEPDRSEPARRRAVLKYRHVLNARHSCLLPNHSLRHFSVIK